MDPTITNPDDPVAPAAPVNPPDPTEVKPSFIWIRDARGYGSVTTTLVTVAFFVTTAAYIYSVLGGKAFDAGACAAYFGTICALYFGRKWNDK